MANAIIGNHIHGVTQDDYPLKQLEDAKVVLDLALWIILFLGDTGTLSLLQMGTATVCLMVSRLTMDTAQQREEDPVFTTADKIARYTPHLEFLSGTLFTGLMMGGLLTPDETLWTIFASQLTLQAVNQGVKRVSPKTTKEEERYDCLLAENDKKTPHLQKKRALEDFKFILEGIALWLILYLGESGHMTLTELGASTIGILTTRLFVDLSLQQKDKTLDKTTKAFSSFEFIAGTLLCSIMMGGVITPDQTLWAFFGVQLLIMMANQIAKRTLSEEEGYPYFMACKGQKPQ